MKKRFVILILFIIFLSLGPPSYGSTEDILQSQSETLNIKGFVEQANQYTEEVFEGIDAGSLLKDAIAGKIDNQTIFTKILNLFGREIKDTIKIIRKHNCNYCNS